MYTGYSIIGYSIIGYTIIAVGRKYSADYGSKSEHEEASTPGKESLNTLE